MLNHSLLLFYHCCVVDVFNKTLSSIRHCLLAGLLTLYMYPRREQRLVDRPAWGPPTSISPARCVFTYSVFSLLCIWLAIWRAQAIWSQPSRPLSPYQYSRIRFAHGFVTISVCCSTASRTSINHGDSPVGARNAGGKVEQDFHGGNGNA